jgi:hypothetical protein
VARTWPPVAALGAGLVHLAVAASAPPLLAVVLAAFGMAEIAWSIAVLRAERLVVPRLALVGAAASSALWASIAFALGAVGIGEPATSIPLPPLAAATVFSLIVAIVCARLLRTTDGAPASSAGGTHPASDATGAWRFLAALASAAVLVGALATPALAATEAGQQAVPHGEHGFGFESGGHEH